MYTVILQIDGIQAEGPLEAAQGFKEWIKDGDFIVEVIDDKGKAFTVDFSEEPGDQLLEIKHYDLDDDDMTRIALVKQLMNEEE